ncbi:MAG: phosphate uptake regulator PhoU [Myxococcales bacterium FL481]|nr:MAG: phosphate uptake regulator PhoU [Myxococcales bacterium FL481]
MSTTENRPPSRDAGSRATETPANGAGAPSRVDVSALRDNLHLMVLEARRQLSECRSMMHERAEVRTAAGSLASRDDYVDHLKSVIENHCFEALASRVVARPDADLLRAVTVTASNLERIADFAVNIADQLQQLEDDTLAGSYEPAPFFSAVEAALTRIEKALFERNMPEALQICRSEAELDELYGRVYRRIIADLDVPGRPKDLVTTLFVYRYLERIGDSLLNIGEAIIFAVIGEKLKIGEFQALRDSLEQSDVDVPDMSELEFEGIWETKSGSRIAAIHPASSVPDGKWVIFKEGAATKVTEERDALLQWAGLAPGIPPRVYSYHRHGDKASLLLEYLYGDTFQKIALVGTPAAADRALVALVTALRGIWADTRQDEVVRPHFVSQLQKRLGSVLTLHPEFATAATTLGSVRHPGFEQIVEDAAVLDDLEAPFSVLIHGDFNADNIIVEPDGETIHLIDLHRSRRYDYVQDVSVFLVSNVRVPETDPQVRHRLERVSLAFWQWAREFADETGDEMFAARLGLGIARSLLTSTRFVVDRRLSREMCLRGIYLLRQLLAHREQHGSDGLKSFELSHDILRF